jgi:hypothetical protein
MPEQMSRKEIKARLAKALRAVVAQHEDNLRKNAEAEATGKAKLAKADVWSPDTDGKVRGSVIERSRPAVAPKKSAKDIRGTAAANVQVAKCGEITKDEMVDGVQPTGEAPPAAPAQMPSIPACPACGVGEAEPLGPMGGMAHFLCASGCGTTFSTPRQENAEAHVDDPLAKADKAAGGTCKLCEAKVDNFKAHNEKEHKFEVESRKKNPKDPIFGKGEPDPTGYIDNSKEGDPKKRLTAAKGETKLPDGPGKAVEAEGSGGDTSKGKLKKAIPGAGGAVKKSPSDTANSASIVANSTGKPEAHLAAAQAHWAAASHAQNTGNAVAAKSHTEAMHAHAKASKMQSAGLSKAGIPGLDAPAIPLPRQAALPGMTPPPAGTPHPETVRTLASIRALKAARSTPPPTPAAAAKPVGQVPAPGALAAGTSAAASTQQAAAPSFISGLLAKFKGVGNKMAMAEVPMDKTTAAEANKEIQGFKSVAKNPTAMPGNVVPKKTVAKSDGTGAPAMPKMPKPVTPAAPAQKAMGTKTAGAAAPGAAKPKAPKA